MSAITKPCLNFTNAIDPSQLIPVEQIKTMEAWDTPALSEPLTAAQTGILVTLVSPYTSPIKVLFADSGDRDTALAAAKTAISTAV